MVAWSCGRTGPSAGHRLMPGSFVLEVVRFPAHGDGPPWESPCDSGRRSSRGHDPWPWSDLLNCIPAPAGEGSPCRLEARMRERRSGQVGGPCRFRRPQRDEVEESLRDLCYDRRRADGSGSVLGRPRRSARRSVHSKAIGSGNSRGFRQTMPRGEVHWHEGMFLRQHQFLTEHRQLVKLIQLDEKWTVHHNWGLRSIQLNTDALGQLSVRGRRVEGATPRWDADRGPR